MKKLSLTLISALFATAAFAQAPAAPAKAEAQKAPVPSATAPQSSAPAASPAAAPAAKAAAPVAAGSDSLEGKAAWYGKKFAGRKTASGQRFNPNAMTAAHPTLPMGSKVKVTNTKNNKSVVVVINDRYPAAGGRIIDVSRAAARKLGFVRSGVTDVKLEVLGTTKLKGAGHRGSKAKKAKMKKA
jgi:rare lipoprotein A